MPHTKIELIDAILHAMALSAVGIGIGIGQVLGSGERLTWRVIVARSLTTGGIAIAAGAVLVWIPGVPLEAQFGIAAALASIGVSTLRRWANRYAPPLPTEEDKT